MDKFHFYGELGKGKHSKVYKARQTKSILYYAIKSVDISQKERVLQEIETMHALQHSHVLRYHQCYETRNHLWLVLEYCVGGDLKALLEKDKNLQEDAIHDFARGLASSLQYCHSQAVIYGDLKPSNLLLDENGKIKLGGFGLSKKLADIEATNGQPNGTVAPMAARSGTPAYMAPELFRHGSVHSSSSDLWALGCVLYECRAGHPPFTGTLLQHLITEIETAEPPELDASPEFRDMVRRLLDKNPATRLTWQQLINHAFWKEPLAALSLPPERALAAFIARHNLQPAGVKAAHNAAATLGVSALRVSRVVRSNLQADAGGTTEYRGATPGEGTGEVRLHTPDAEVDFDERTSEAGTSELDDGGAAANAVDDSAREGASAGPEQANQAAVLSGMARVSMTTSPAAAVAAAQRHTQQRQKAHSQQGGQQAGGISGTGAQGAAATSPTVAATHAPLTATWGGAAATPVQSQAPEAGSVAALIWHVSDNVISTIANNPRIEKITQPKFDMATLQIAAWDGAHLEAASAADKEAFLLQIYRALCSAAPIRDKVNVLAYMETQLCTHTASANALINSRISALLVSMLRGATTSGKGSREKDVLRARLASVLGLLLQHALYITPTLAQTGVVDILTVVAADKSDKVQRRGIAALGELLFYISDKDPTAGQHSDNGWAVPSATINLITRLLQGGNQDVVQHYAAHTIENIVLQGGPWAARFADDTLASNLITLWNTAKQHSLRSTAASALSRLVRHAPAQLSMLITTFGTRILVNGLGNPSEIIQAACANILAMALASHQLGATTRATLQGGVVQDYGAMQGALKLMDAQPPTLKAKGCLLVALLIRNDPCALATACLLGLVEAADGVTRGGDGWTSAHQEYVAASMQALRGEIAAVVPHVVDQLATMTHPATSTTIAKSLRASAWDVGGTAFNFIKVVPTLMASPALHPAVVSAGLVQSLAAVLLATASAVDELSVEIKAEVLQVLDALCVVGGAPIAAAHGAALAVHLGPALATIAGSAPDVDTRFQALKLLLDLLVLLKAVPQSTTTSHGGQGLAEEVETAVAKRLLPRMEQLLLDEAPLPLYTLKLLATLLDNRTGWAPTVARAGLVPAVVEFLDLRHPNNNVHNLKVAQRLVLGGALPPMQLAQLQVAHRVAAVLAYTYSNRVAPFLEPALELAAALLSYYTTPDGAGEVCDALLPHLPIFVELVGSPDVSAAMLASQCAQALSELAPGEAAELFFTHDGASLLEAAMTSSPPGAAGDSARRHLMLALLATSTAAHGAFVAEPGAVRQLRSAVAKLPTGSSEMEAVAKSTARMLASLQ